MTIRESKRFDLEAIKRERPLTDVLAESGVLLIPEGGGTYRAHCPFHERGHEPEDDERPSLLVDGRDQHFHCFDCNMHGDVIDFVMRRDRVAFAEACSRLATSRSRPDRSLPDRAAISAAGSATESPVSLVPRAQRRSEHLGLDEQVVMNTALAIYQQALWQDRRALDYVRARGIPDWAIRECALGYSDGHSLESYLRRRRGELRVAIALGLLRRRETGDRGAALPEHLAGRIVVPELRGGQAVWFVGRALDDSLRPKYLGQGAERSVLGFERAAGKPEVFLCPSVFDYLTAVSWRLPAFSLERAQLPLERLAFLNMARRVWGLLDRAAASQTSEWLAAALGERFRPLVLPDGLDLNDLARRVGGRAEFFLLLAEAREADRRRDQASSREVLADGSDPSPWPAPWPPRGGDDASRS